MGPHPSLYLSLHKSKRMYSEMCILIAETEFIRISMFLREVDRKIEL